MQHRFDSLNGRYFKGELPRIPVRWKAGMLRRDLMGQLLFNSSTCEPSIIYVARELRGMSSVAELTLLHEMVHLAILSEGDRRTQHGRKFELRMLRLAKQGAMCGLW